jgi:cation diffusion facilitator family transporter
MHSDDDTLRHDHVFLGDAHDAHARRTRYVVALTTVMMVIEIVAGWLTHSMALLADGLHKATHAGALGIAAFAYGYARRHAEDRRFTFGTGKVGDLTGFASSLILAVIALGIGIESVQRLLAPAGIAYVQAISIALLGLAVNIASAWLLRGTHHHDHGSGHGHAHAGHDDDNNLRSACVHVLAEARVSVLAVLALAAGLFLGWRWMDAAMGILGAVVIGRWSYGLLRDTGAVLLDAAANPGLEQEIRDAIEDGDAKITDLHVWRVGPGKYGAIIALVAADPLSPADYAARVRIHDELVHITVEPHRCSAAHRKLRVA